MAMRKVHHLTGRDLSALEGSTVMAVHWLTTKGLLPIRILGLDLGKSREGNRTLTCSLRRIGVCA
jgi:hypothetical protein